MMACLRTFFVAIAVLLAAALPSHAVNPDEMLKDPVLEQRARDISAGIRCLVCQNESVDASNADLAKDLRVLIRERLMAGDSDQQVRDFLVSRYGEFVLLKPPFSVRNIVLWLLPLILLAIAGSLLIIRSRNGSGTAAKAELTTSEKQRLKQLLDDQ